MNANTSLPIVFIVQGQEQPAPAAGASRGAGGLAPDAPAGTVKYSVRLASARGTAEAIRAEAVPGEDLVVLRIANGPTLTLHPETARDLMLAQAGQDPRTSRGAARGKALGEIDVPAQLAWPSLEPRAAGRGAQRGLFGEVLLSFFQVITRPLRDRAADFVADEAVHNVDGQVNPGLYLLNPNTLGKLKDTGKPLDLSGQPAGEKPLLVFLHGTFVDTASTFGKLWSPPSDRLEKLFNQYDNQVYALDHPTLGASPIDNALALADALPAGARLHLLTHSRGGLVAETLARACGRPLQNEAELAGFFPGAGYKSQLDHLKKLAGRVKEKKITVERMVRVACPAHGTLLASKRLDAYLSVLKWALDLAGVPVLPALVEFLGEVALRRADPAMLPGLEAMMPGSPLLRWLQAGEDAIPGQLRVVAGDMEGDSVASWAKTLLADAFFWTDNDLVVQTRSMYGGTPRGHGAAAFFLHRGGKASHFEYFENADTVDAIIGALAKTPPATFRAIGPLSWAGEDTGGLREPKAPAKPDPGRPAVFLLPGILGSHLAADGQRVWLSRRIVGGLGRLRYGAENVAQDGPIDAVYQDLIEFLGQTHEVIPFGFDWRLPLENEAKRLGDEVAKALDARRDSGQPVRLLAHSMGGLLARAMQLERQEIWKRLMNHPGGRLLMLGTPNGGSWAPMQVLSGDDTFGNWLAGLGSPFNSGQARQIMAGMPGFIQLQAALLDETLNLGQASTWQALAEEDLARLRERSRWHKIQLDLGLHDWGLPGQKVLDAAVALRRRLDGQHFRDLPPADKKILLVAGRADFTPDGYQMDSEGLVYLDTPQDGDGRVTLANAQLDGVPAWILDCAHGDLPKPKSKKKRKEAFDAFLQLLTQGETSLLEPLARASRGGAGEEAPPPVRVPSRPSRRRFADASPPESPAAAFGLPGRDAEADALQRLALPVTVVNGNLKFVRQALMIGHYRSLALTGTEKEVNYLIGGKMETSLAMGLYSDTLGFQQVFVNRHPDPEDPFRRPRPEAVIVVGLGEEGKLQSMALASTVRQGVIAYAQRVAEQDGAKTSFELAATLIGSGGTRISAGLSAQMVAQGVQEANARLAVGGWPQVSHLHLTELFLDRATEAWQALRGLAEAKPSLYHITEYVKTGHGPLTHPLNSSYRGADYDFITAVTMSGDSGERGIAYTINTRRARTEVRAQRLQGRLLADLVKNASNDHNQNSQIGRILFKLLVPPEMEPFLGGTSEMLIELDQSTAAIPWELLDIDDKTRSEDDPDPWAIRCKLLRKLRTVEFREQVTDSGSEDAVLVIGEPLCDPSRYPPLPGALAEARAVAEFLSGPKGIGDKGDKNVCAILDGEKDAPTIVNALLERDYRIVHIAGHGEPGKNGGVVLSNGTFLGAREIQNMRRVPELVFVNCCHSAKQDSGRLLQTKPYHRAEFAANLAEALIKIGVRCVIAAGWAVNDTSAMKFATTFYKFLLAGKRFIEAVGEARRVTFKAGAGNNTWAAYQCYGDPDWNWKGAQAGRQQPDSFAFLEEKFDGIASSMALRNALHIPAVMGRFHSATEENDSNRIDQVRYLENRFAPRWGREGAVAEAFGTALAAMGETDRAIEWYEKALAAEDGGASIKISEQLGNLRARRAFERCLAAQVGDPAALAKAEDKAREDIKEALAMLEGLVKLRPTLERLSLCGSAYKRLAMLESSAGKDADANKAIKHMAEKYREAEKLARAAESDFFYPAMNRMAAELIANFSIPAWKGFQKADLAEVRRNLEDKTEGDPDFWSEAARHELAMYEGLAERKLAERLEKIREGYADLHRRVAAKRLWRSVYDQACFVLDHYPADSQNPQEQAAATKLRELLGQYAAS